MKPKKKWKKWLMAAGILAVLLHLGFLGEYNVYNLIALKYKERQLTQQIEQGELERKRLLVEIDRLKHDSTYIEKIAREEYKMGKDDETIFIIKSRNDE